LGGTRLRFVLARPSASGVEGVRQVNTIEVSGFTKPQRKRIYMGLLMLLLCGLPQVTASMVNLSGYNQGEADYLPNSQLQHHQSLPLAEGR
jgi:hypothetical protein